jgi:CheY-like chemotaxis protein
MSDFTLLLVEDNPADADLLKEYLTENIWHEYHILLTDTLGAAIKTLEREKVDIVLLDLSLPDSSGIDTVRTLIVEYPELAIVVLTGLKDQQVALQAVHFGAQDYIEKDQLTPALLHRSIAYAIERKKALLEIKLLYSDLSRVLEEMEVLENILPLCVSCRKVHGDDGNWLPINVYIKKGSAKKKANLLCPTCRKELNSDRN